MFVFIVLIVVAIIFLIVATSGSATDRKVQEKSGVRQDPRRNPPDTHNWCGHYFRFDEQSREFVIGVTRYNFSDFLGFEILYSNDVNTTVKTSTSSAIGRGIVGAALFGPIGAIAGASTAKKIVTSKPGPQVMIGANIYLKGKTIRINARKLYDNPDGTNSEIVEAYKRFDSVYRANLASKQ